MAVQCRQAKGSALGRMGSDKNPRTPGIFQGARHPQPAGSTGAGIERPLFKSFRNGLHQGGDFRQYPARRRGCFGVFCIESPLVGLWNRILWTDTLLFLLLNFKKIRPV
jgi:hypothetical protein